MRLVCLAALIASGCSLYLPSNPSLDAACYESPPSRSFQLRDPESGACQTFGGTSCGCEPCAQGTVLPNWAPCNGACEQITDETQCLATAHCHATYLGDLFWGCWEVEPNQTATPTCLGLDAFTCTSQDSCVGRYTPGMQNGLPAFASCAAETGGYCLANTDCLYGESCDTSTCHQPVCGDCPSCGACAPTCYGVCAAVAPPPCATLDESHCTARSDCEAVYNGENCTCDARGCTCQTETFAYCEPRQ
jgi:hypothetical protein